jgi:hypothetical protein
LAGREPFDPAVDDRIPELVTELQVGGECIGLVHGRAANERLARARRLIHAQGGAPGAPPEFLTEANEDFGEVRAVVEAGLSVARDISRGLADDLLVHTRMLGVLNPATSGGMVSASSRLFPGLILIDRPTNPYDVAEALIHEGAHQKFFDLAITRDFLSADVSGDRFFRPSWSGARWPVEQVIAAFHAYACLAQFAQDVVARDSMHLRGADSLLPSARERELEIGRWLLEAEELLESDGRWFVRAFLGKNDASDTVVVHDRRLADGLYELDPKVRVTRMRETGRVLLARPGNPPSLLWLDRRVRDLVDHLPAAPAGLESAEVTALEGLVESSVVRRVSVD